MGQFRGKRRQLIPRGRLETEENGSIWLSEGHDARHISRPFQNYAGLRGQTQDPHPYPRFLQNDGSSTCGFIFTNIGMVGDS